MAPLRTGHHHVRGGRSSTWVCNPTQSFQQSASAWFNTSCYLLPAFGTRGNAGRHGVYSQGLRNWDSSIDKQWVVKENKSFQFRAEFFNFLNATTFDPPEVFIGTVPRSGRFPPRPVRLGGKSNLR